MYQTVCAAWLVTRTLTAAHVFVKTANQERKTSKFGQVFAVTRAGRTGFQRRAFLVELYYYKAVCNNGIKKQIPCPGVEPGPPA